MAKGRDKNLIELRDEALCRRYYYWTEVQRLRFDDALKVLSRQEFFISEWKSHSTLTLLATQDLPTFLYYMIDPLKSWCWGAILFYPFKNSRFS